MNVQNDSHASIGQASRLAASRPARGKAVSIPLSLACAVAAACSGAWAMPAPAPAAVSPVSAADGNPLIAAAASGSVDTMARLLAAGARVDDVVRGDETALITAARKNQPAAVRYLASHGADVNLGVTADNGQWRTPLNQARSDAVMRFLRGQGATPDGARRP